MRGVRVSELIAAPCVETHVRMGAAAVNKARSWGMTIAGAWAAWVLGTAPPAAAAPTPDRTLECDVAVVGGGLAGSAAAYEALLAGKTVCLTELTDWVGGQISSQGTSALDERQTQREKLFFPRGYLELRESLLALYDGRNPGECWVSALCFLPSDAHTLLLAQLQRAAERGGGTLHWLPSTVIKDLATRDRQITTLTAIAHTPAPGAPPLNVEHLSEHLADWYAYEDSPNFTKTILQLQPPTNGSWIVIEATETGELIGLADVPYALGSDPRSYQEPSAATLTGDRHCTQGFTYTFVMEALDTPQTHAEPAYYREYAPYFSYELERLASFDLVFTYRRLWSPQTGSQEKFGGIGFTAPTPGDLSMQNWTWGNDYRPGTPADNFLYTRLQLATSGQLAPGGWLGGWRIDALRRGEEHALSYFHWLVAGTTDSQLGEGVKDLHPNHRLVTGLDSPMGTGHGLSKFPYIREGRRIIGRPSFGYPDGFKIAETDITRKDFTGEFYQRGLDTQQRRLLAADTAAGVQGAAVVSGDLDPAAAERRTRARIYEDSVGIGHYPIDFHPCMDLSPVGRPGNRERPGERQGQGVTYPFQIPLRAMIPQEIDNLLVAGKSIAVSHIAAAAYRVHSFEWSVGAAAGQTAVFTLENDLLPYELVDELPLGEPGLQQLRSRLAASGNPTAFPETSFFNLSWEDWR